MTVQELKDWFSADEQLRPLLKEKELLPLISQNATSALTHEDYGLVISLFDRIEKALQDELTEIGDAQHALAEEYVSLSRE